MTGILDFFVPREKKFFDMLMELSSRTSTGARLFHRFIGNYAKLSYAKRAEAIEDLKKVERDCDTITHRIAIELNRTFLTPIDREDIHKLSTLIDDLMDIIYNVSHKLVLYNIRKLPKYAIELTNTVFESVQEVDRMVSKLKSGGKVGMHIKRIHELEKEADSLRDEAVAHIFGNSEKAVNVIKFKDLYEWLETVCDKSEDIADVIEGIVIKYA